MKSLLLITPDFRPDIGGIQNVLYSLARNMANFKMSVVAPGTEGTELFDKEQPFKIYRAHRLFNKGGKLLLFPLLLRSLEALRKERPDMVICGHILAGPIGLLFKKLYGIPYAVYAYALEVMGTKYRQIVASLLSNADRVFALSEFTRRFILSLGVEERRIAKAPPTVDCEYFNPSVDGSEVTKEFRLAGGRVILTVGRLERGERYKGHDMVIRACPTMLAKVPNLVYLIVGDGTDRPRLESLARKLGVAQNVLFAGSVPPDDLPKYYSSCDLYVMPTRQIVNEKGVNAEGFGLVFLEASACGKPSIGGRSGGVPEAILHGVTGLLVDPEDPEAIANAVVKLITDQGLARRMGEEGRRRVLREFTPEIVTQRVESIIEEVIGKA